MKGDAQIQVAMVGNCLAIEVSRHIIRVHFRALSLDMEASSVTLREGIRSDILVHSTSEGKKSSVLPKGEKIANILAEPQA